MTKQWIHLDINSYFASLLQQEIPSLRNKPMGAVKDRGRTCLIAVSKEAKRCGVKTGMRLAEARLFCPQIIPVPVHFELCWSSTKKLIELLESFSPDIEVFSLDEAFINYTPLRGMYPDLPRLCSQLQEAVKASLGEWVSCSIGTGPSKLLAKLSSEVAPADSQLHTTWDSAASLLARASFEQVCGIGARLSRKLQLLGLTCVYQLNFVDPAQLQALVGPYWAAQLSTIAQGHDPDFLVRPPPQHMKSVSRSITGYAPTTSEAELFQILANLTTEVVHKLRKMSLCARLIAVSLRSTTGDRWGAHRTLTHHVIHWKDIWGTVQELLDQRPLFKQHHPIIKCRVSLGLLQPSDLTNPPLLPQWHKQEKVERACHDINARFGLFTIRSARLNAHDIVRPEVTGFLGDKTYQLL